MIAFYDAVVLALSNHALFNFYGYDSSIGPVRYELPEQVSVQDVKAIDPFVKRKKYAWQKECRIVIRGAPVTEPVTLKVPAIIPLLKRVR